VQQKAAVVITGGPSPSPEERAAARERLDTRVRADLWSAVWEASQVLTYDEIRHLVEGTIREIQADEP
jgi:hypothetical protein